MPNLDYDPRNPTDLLDRPIKEGDYVAWGTTFGRSPAVAVCQIERIRFIRKNPAYPYSDPVNLECDRSQAEAYQLVLLPLKSTGRVTNEEYVPGGFHDPNGMAGRSFFRKLDRPKTKTIQLVKNVVKLENL